MTKKNMFDAKYLINIHIFLVMGMTNIDDNTHLDLLFQKALRYEYHQKRIERNSLKQCNSFWT